MIDTLLLILALLALITGSFTDIKKREVPDIVSYGLIFAALGVRLLYSILNLKPSIFFNGLAGFALFFILAHIIYQSRQWGGGDAKLFMGLGAVLGINFLGPKPFAEIGIFFLLIIFLGALYGLIFSICLAVKNKNVFVKAFRENIKEFKFLVMFVNIFLIIGIISFVLIHDKILAFLISGVSLILFLGIYSFMLTKSVEESCLFRNVKAGKLTEGDWVAQTIRFKGKTIVKKNNLGITKEQINALKGYKKLILIKLGIPFVPAFLLAFIALICFKEVILGLI